MLKKSSLTMLVMFIYQQTFYYIILFLYNRPQQHTEVREANLWLVILQKISLNFIYERNNTNTLTLCHLTFFPCYGVRRPKHPIMYIFRK